VSSNNDEEVVFASFPEIPEMNFRDEKKCCFSSSRKFFRNQESNVNVPVEYEYFNM
jgi:hypothetical protein